MRWFILPLMWLGFVLPDVSNQEPLGLSVSTYDTPEYWWRESVTQI